MVILNCALLHNQSVDGLRPKLYFSACLSMLTKHSSEFA
jgi:hypothetical protein